MSEEEFQAVAQKAMDAGVEGAVADEWQVSKTTVQRWATGMACPLPRTRREIAVSIEKHLSTPKAP